MSDVGGKTMQVIEKWTVRNMPERALDRLWEIREASPGYTLGMLLGDAVEQYYQACPEAEVTGDPIAGAPAMTQ